MPKLITHKFVSTIPDGDDTGLVRPSNWNDTHNVSGVAESGANSDITSMTGVTGGISTPDYIQYDTTATPTIAVGKTRWNVDTGTLAFGIIDGTQEVQIGQQMYAQAVNAEAITITKGQPVYLYQATGNRASVKLAYNTSDATSAKTLGLAAQDIAAGATGFIITQGVLDKLNTGSYNEGDTLYLGATAGSLTATKPSAPNHLVYIGVVERANNGNGQIYVRVQNGYELDEIHDVQISSPTTGQTLVYNQSTQLWNNSNAPTIIGGSINNTPIGATTPSTGTFTAVDIATTGTDAQIAPNTGITGWNYSGNFKSVATEDSAPTGLFFSPDGLNMYVTGATGDDVNQYTLSSAWDVSTASYVRVFSTAAQDTDPNDIFFKPDGLTMFVIGNANNTVYQYTLSSAWDISTASYASKSFSVATQETTPVGLWFKSDGTIMYVVGTLNDTVYQYNLSTAWDVSTASYASISFSVGSQESNPNQVNLSADGTKMWITGTTGDDINEYTLGTAWNVSTATFVNNFYIGFQDAVPTGLFIDSTAANRVYMVGSTNDAVYQYNTETNSISAVTDVFNTTSNARVQGNLSVQSNAYVDGNFTVLGNIGGNSSISSSGLTNSGTTTLATSTTTQTVALGAGATTSGSTKTVNIGTAGVSGSTTNINIGSSVSGATSRTTLNGIVIDSISAAITAAGATQGTATALVSNINNVTVVATNADGVILPTAVAGMRILVRNSDAADTLKIYPATGGTINALAANAAFTLAAGSTTELFASTTTQWYTF